MILTSGGFGLAGNPETLIATLQAVGVKGAAGSCEKSFAVHRVAEVMEAERHR
jgi:acyl CoA:acetate/3-ketoacid CoA transferase alpha subunit